MAVGPKDLTISKIGGEMSKKNGKVVHVPQDLHEQLRVYCVARNIIMKQWVTHLIEKGLAADAQDLNDFVLISASELRNLRQAATAREVDKKPYRHYGHPDPETEAEIWNQPPFWLRTTTPSKKDDAEQHIA